MRTEPPGSHGADSEDVRSTKSAGAQLRSLIAGGGLVVAPGAFDPFTAMLIENVGFHTVYLGGNAMGTHLGVGQPFVTMTEALDCTARARRSVRCPLVVDANAGFGDPAHTYRTVQEFEGVGAAAIHIDDQPAPKRAHYHLGRGRVTGTAQMAEKLQAGLQARSDPDFVIIGKTDALRSQPLAETVERSRVLVETGIDMLLVVDLPPEDAPLFRKEFPTTPLVWIGGHRGPVPSTSVLEDAGFALALYPFTTLATVAQSVRNVWTHLREHGSPPHAEEFLSTMRQHVLELVDMPTYWKIERETTESVLEPPSQT